MITGNFRLKDGGKGYDKGYMINVGEMREKRDGDIKKGRMGDKEKEKEG